MEAVEPLSPRAYQLADEYQLGAPQAEYRNDNQVSWGFVALLLFVGILFLSIVFLGLHSSSPDSTGDWRGWLNSLTENIQALMFMLIGAITLIGGLAGLALGVQAFVQGEMRVYVCAKGFAIARRRVAEVVRWEDIEEVQRRIVYSQPRSKHKKPGELDSLPVSFYTILPKSGKDHTFPEKPGATIEYELTAYLLPRTIAAYQAGKALDFGWLILDAQGIRLNTTSSKEPRRARRSAEQNLALRLIFALLDRKQAPSGSSASTGERFLLWSELEMPWIDESKSTLIISRKTEWKHWAVLPLSRVTNVALCLALVEHVLSGKVREVA